MRRNTTKSETQIDILQACYVISKGSLSTNDIFKIGLSLGLTYSQVYKWMWDKVKQQKKNRQLSNQLEEGLVDQATETQNQTHQIIFNKCCIKIPTNLRIAVEFTINTNIQSWAKKILRYEGWQLIKLEKGEQNNSNDLSYQECQLVMLQNTRQQQEISKQKLEVLMNSLNESDRFDLMNEFLNQKLPCCKNALPSNNNIKEENNHEDEKKLGTYFLEKEPVGGCQLSVHVRTIKKKPFFVEQQDSSFKQDQEQNSLNLISTINMKDK